MIRNVNSAAQLLNIQRGTNEVSLDLSADQAQGPERQQQAAGPAHPVGERLLPVRELEPEGVVATSPNPHFQNAIRYGLDYNGFVQLAGSGALRATGVIPSMFLGALKKSAASSSDLAKAKAELTASGSPTRR